MDMEAWEALDASISVDTSFSALLLTNLLAPAADISVA
jgi:hypothetical protein